MELMTTTWDGPRRCSFASRAKGCGEPAIWAIFVGVDACHLACDAHRNDVLLGFEVKDVAGFYRIDELLDERAEPG